MNNILSEKLSKKIYTILFFMLFFHLMTDNLLAKKPGDYNWFWMFYESENYNKAESFTVRPFFTQFKNKNGMFQASFMPAFFWRYKNSFKDEWNGLFGFYNSIDFTHTDKKRDFDIGLFPLFFYGKSINKEDNYLMILPFGGTLKGKFGHDKISAYLFPGFLLFIFFPPATLFSFQTTAYLLASLIPTYTSYNFKDYKAWALFWPLIQRGKSSKRDDFRILPFYAHNYKKNFYDNYSILFIFNYMKFIYKDDVHKTLFILPFFGRKWSKSGRLSAYTILWPFFSWGYDKRSGSVQYHLPWPLVQIGDSKKPKMKKRIFFPFYGKYEYMGNETFFVTPLYFSLKKKTAVFKSEYYINFFLFWYFKRDYKITDKYYGKRWRYFKFWPIFSVEYNDIGDFSFNLLSILPLRDPIGYEKLYNPFWTLFEYKSFRDGEKRLGLLFRTYFQRWDKNFIQIKIPILFTLERNKNKLTELSFLLSFFSYTNNREGRYLRIFWIPFKIGKGDAVALSEDEKEINERKKYLSRGIINYEGNRPPLNSFNYSYNF